MTAIVTDVEYRMSLAIIRDLGMHGIRIIACHRAESAGPPLGFQSKFTDTCYTLSDNSYSDELYDLCRKLTEDDGKKPVMIPTGAKTLALIAQRRQAFNDVCGLLILSQDQLRVLNNKTAVKDLADKLDIPTPNAYVRQEGESIDTFINRIPLPCVVKPEFGEGLGLTAADRYSIAKTAEELSKRYEHFERLCGLAPIVQDYLPGRGLGCSVLAYNGQIHQTVCHRRIREYPISGGPSTCAETIHSPELVEYATRLVSEIGLNGIAMLEFKENSDGKPLLLEVNPRVWGTYPLTRVGKTGFSLAWFSLAWNMSNPEFKIPLLPPPPFHIARMTFTASDLMSASGYWRKGEKKRAIGALCSLINPSVKDGVWEWRDTMPAITYYRSLLSKRS